MILFHVIKQFERAVVFRLGKVEPPGPVTLRAVVGRHSLDETLSETDAIKQNIREILQVQTEEWGIKVAVVELRDIQLPERMPRAMSRHAEREKRACVCTRSNARRRVLTAGVASVGRSPMGVFP